MLKRQKWKETYMIFSPTCNFVIKQSVEVDSAASGAEYTLISIVLSKSFIKVSDRKHIQQLNTYESTEGVLCCCNFYLLSH